MGAAGRAYVMREHDIKRLAEALAEIYATATEDAG